MQVQYQVVLGGAGYNAFYGLYQWLVVSVEEVNLDNLDTRLSIVAECGFRILVRVSPACPKNDADTLLVSIGDEFL